MASPLDLNQIDSPDAEQRHAIQAAPAAAPQHPEDVIHRAALNESEEQAGPPPVDQNVIEKFGHLLPQAPAAQASSAPAAEAATQAAEADPYADIFADPAPQPQADPRLAALEQQNAMLMQMLQRQVQPQAPQPQAPAQPAYDPAAEEQALLAEMQRFTLPDGRRLDQADQPTILAYMAHRKVEQRAAALEQKFQEAQQQIAQYQQYVQKQAAAEQAWRAQKYVEKPIQAHLAKQYGNVPPHITEQITQQAAAWVAEGYDARESMRAAVQQHKATLEWAKSLQSKPTAPGTQPASQAPAQPRDPQGRFAPPSAADRAQAIRTAQPGQPASIKSAKPQEIIELAKELERRRQGR